MSFTVPRAVLVRTPRLSCSPQGSPSFAECAHCEVETEDRKVGGEQELQQPKVGIEERCGD